MVTLNMSSVEIGWFVLLKKHTENKDFEKRYSKTNKSKTQILC